MGPRRPVGDALRHGVGLCPDQFAILRVERQRRSSMTYPHPQGQ